MWTSSFWKDAGERAIKTGAQVAITALAAVATFDDLGAGWDEGLFLVGVSMVVSVLTSIVSSRVGSPEDASLVTTRKEGDA